MSDPLIVLDTRRTAPGMTGVGRRVAHIARELSRRGTDMRFALLTNTPDYLRKWLSEDGSRAVSTGVEIWPVDVPPDAHPKNEIWLHRTLPKMLRERGANLFHGPAFQIPPRMADIPSVITVHDMAHRHKPVTHSWRFRQWLNWCVRNGCRHAARVVVPSEAVKRDVEIMHPESKGNVRVVPGGVSPEWRPLAPVEVEANKRALNLPRRYLIHIGTFEPRKNHQWLLEVFSALCADMEKPPNLLMVGRPGPSLPDVHEWVTQSPWRGKIHLRHDVKDGELHDMLASAEALVFPSLLEGFGLPVVEAMACGVPAIASDVSGLDGFRHSPVILRPLGDLRAWLDTLVPLLNDADHRGRVADEGAEHSSLYTWQRTCDALLDLYRDVLST